MRNIIFSWLLFFSTIVSSSPFSVNDLYLGGMGDPSISCGAEGKLITVSELRTIPNWCSKLTQYNILKVFGDDGTLWQAMGSGHSCDIKAWANPSSPGLCLRNSAVPPRPVTPVAIEQLYVGTINTCGPSGRTLKTSELKAIPNWCDKFESLTSRKIIAADGSIEHLSKSMGLWQDSVCEINKSMVRDTPFLCINEPHYALFVGRTEPTFDSCGVDGKIAFAAELQKIPSWCDRISPSKKYKINGDNGTFGTIVKQGSQCEISSVSEPSLPSLCLKKPLASNQLILLNENASCEKGRMITHQELQLMIPKICLSTMHADHTPLYNYLYQVKDNNGNSIFANSADACYSDAKFAGSDVRKLCVPEPEDSQLFAYEGINFNGDDHFTGYPVIFIDLNESRSVKNTNQIYSGNYRSFKIGKDIEVTAYTGDNLTGEKIMLNYPSFITAKGIKSFFVRDKKAIAPEETYEEKYIANKMDFNVGVAQGNAGCSIEINTQINGDEQLGEIYATITAVDRNNEPYKTQQVNIPYTLDKVDDGFEPKANIMGTATIDVNVNGKQLDNCFVSKIEIPGMGRAQLDFSVGAQSGKAIWYQIANNQEPINNSLHAAQLLAEPLFQKFSSTATALSSRSKDEYRLITKAYDRVANYNVLQDIILNGDAGISNGHYGFSVDFLDLRTSDDINDFLIEKVILPAYKLGLIDERLVNSKFADELRRETLARMRQDSQKPYGSGDHILSSLAMQYIDVIPQYWQRNKFDQETRLLIEQWLDVLHPYMTQTISTTDKTPLYELWANLAFINSNEISRIEALDAFFGRNLDIKVDYEKGLISNRYHYGGYLGRHYMQIAAHIFSIPVTDVTPTINILTKTALESIGIDTIYTYGSVRNIKSNLLHRITSSISNPEQINEDLHTGGAPEMLDALSEKLSDSGNKINSIQQKLLHETFSYSGIPIPDEPVELWNTLIDFQGITDKLSSLNMIIKIEQDGSKLESIPFTDEQFTKSILYACSIPPILIDQGWEKYYKQNAVPPQLNMFYSGGVDPSIIKCHNETLLDFEIRFGGKFKVRELWDKYFYELASTLGEYAGTYIDMHAKLNGKGQWNTPEKYNSINIIEKYIEKYTQLSNVTENGMSTLVKHHNGQKWFVAGDLPYSLKTDPGTVNLMFLKDIEFISPINQDLRDSFNPLWEMLNPKGSSECGFEDISGMYPYWYTCYSKDHFTHGTTGSNKEVLAAAFTQYLIDHQHEFKTVNLPIDYIISLFKALLPVWGTLEALQANDMGGFLFGLITDVMFFAPALNLTSDLADLGISAVRPVLKPGVQALGSSIGLGSFISATVPDITKYTTLAKKKIPKMPPKVINDIDDIKHSGHLKPAGKPSKLPSEKPQRVPKPDDNAFDLDALESKFQGDKSKLKRNHDGTYSDEKGDVFVKDGEDFYKAKYDQETGQWYLVDKDGNLTTPIKKNGDKWESDESKALSVNDFIRFGAQEFHGAIRNIKKHPNGLITVNGDTNVIKVDRHYFKAEHDPVYKTVYVYSVNWKRTPIKHRKNKWYKNVQIARNCTYKN